ncbi:MAG: redoxin domain-containing protein [Actinobacteria bacterium]|nr:redoxin domain-containing protein [Actinomycetota bacterium]
MGAKVAGVSTDSSWSHAAYRQRLKLRFPLLSDYNREIVGDYVGFYEDVAGYKGVNRRGIVIVDGERRLRWRWVTDNPGEMPDTEMVREAVQELWK